MKSFSTLSLYAFAALLLLVISSQNLHAQRPQSVVSNAPQFLHSSGIVLDDGNGHTTTLFPGVTGASSSDTITFPPSNLIWPATNAAGVLTNNGTGNLTWVAGGGSYLPLAGGTMTGAVSGLQAGTTLGTGTPVAGGVYRDNQILASGFVEGNVLSVVTGNVSVSHISAGLYQLTFTVPVTGIQHPLIVTPDFCCNADIAPTANIQWISLSPLQYYVRTYGFNTTSKTFVQEDYNFTFILVP